MIQENKTAVVNGRDLEVSLKYNSAICNYIKGKEIDRAIAMLEEVAKMKKPVPMRGEIAHKKGIMSGRYPVKGALIFIRLLKSLKANAVAKDLELEKYRIHCIPNLAPRPYKKFGQGRFKRSHVEIKLIPVKEKQTEKQNKEKK